MRTPTSWRVPALAALIAVVAGCGLLDPADLEVTVTLSESVLVADSSIRVEVRATNMGSDAVDIGGSGCPQVFEVRDLLGDVVGPQGVLCTLALVPPVRIEAGESFAFEYVWAGGSNGDPSARLPAGSYTIRGWVDPMTGGRVFSGSQSVQVMDAPVP
jgi:hypothetical protein